LHDIPNNGEQMTPTLIVTRPAPKGDIFAGEMRARFGDRLRIVVSPLLEIEPVAVTQDLTDVAGVIFTSAQAVGAVSLPAGLAAWCVGPKTAECAKESGFNVITGPGDARALVEMITNAAPCGRLAHIRGRHVHEPVAQVLCNAGVACADVIGYDQHPLALSDSAKNVLNGELSVILPLFSARTATILGEQGPFCAPLHLVVMSEQVKQAAGMLDAQTVSIAAKPDGSAMGNATVARLNALLNRNGNG
jgi:uroporphyrinogen-III synthase